MTTRNGDARWPSDVGRYLREAIRDSQRYPLMGGQTSNIAPCAFWPAPREPRTEIRDNQADSVLLVQSSHDTQTPVEGAANLRELLADNSRVVWWDPGRRLGRGSGHQRQRGASHGDHAATAYRPGHGVLLRRRLMRASAAMRLTIQPRVWPMGIMAVALSPMEPELAVKGV